jgi:uncharacterized protein (DUF608 family)
VAKKDELCDKKENSTTAPAKGSFKRREFLASAGGALALPTFLGSGFGATPPTEAEEVSNTEGSAPPAAGGITKRVFNSSYEGDYLNQIAFPLGGLGAGMLCLEGTGTLSHVSIRNSPDVFNEPCIFAAISIRGEKPLVRVLEGPVPRCKIFSGTGCGDGFPTSNLKQVWGGTSSLGLPRFANAKFKFQFPFATVTLHDERSPLDVEITGWSPFIPGDADNSSMPFAALEYRFRNRSTKPIEAVFSFNTVNFMNVQPPSGTENGEKYPNAVRATPGGFVLWGGGSPDRPWEEGSFSVSVQDDPSVKVNHAWFRSDGFDPITMVWKDVKSAACFERPPVTDLPAPGASLYVPISLQPNASKTVKLRLCWYVPKTSLGGTVWKDFADQTKPPSDGLTHQPWYSARFPGIEDVTSYCASNYDSLRKRSAEFSHCLYDSTLPPEVMEAVGANLAILKSPTVLRQADGRMWAWEGCNDEDGSCYGSCTHVWNYAQSVSHLFPALERTLRETEFGPSTDDTGFQAHRSAIPIRESQASHDMPAAADGQLGGIMKAYRDWRISGNTDWLRNIWPKVRKSLDYCITTWDPDKKGWLEEPHLNTYDISFWGPNGMCASIYLGALRAAVLMGQALGDNINEYRELYEEGVKLVEAELFNGEYFIQKIEWKNLRIVSTADSTLFDSEMHAKSPEMSALIEKEGPVHQYGSGCLSDGVIGAWLAQVCGVGDILSPAKVSSHLRSVHRYNLKQDLSSHANPQRPGYALGRDGGLLICTWPKGGELSLPFIYSNEVWTGIEYQVASHLIMTGAVEEGLEVVRACRARYDGRSRNPFDEYEAGHWYARAQSSFALLQACSGARYDAVDKVLYLRPAMKGDFRAFLSTATGFGTVGVHGGKPFFKAVSGTVDVTRIDYKPAHSS